MAFIKVYEGEGIDDALKRFKRKEQKEGILREYKKHTFFLSPSEERRSKHRAAVKRFRRKQNRERRTFNPDWKPRHAFGRRYEPKVPSDPLLSLLSLREEDEEESIGTVLMIVIRTTEKEGNEVKELLTLKDKEKSKIGFPTGKIRVDETLVDAGCREAMEETNLKIEIPKALKPFHEINVGKSDDPHVMSGMIVEKYSGTMKAGIEIEDGSLRWRDFNDIDSLIMQDIFLPNHSSFYNKFIEKEEG